MTPELKAKLEEYAAITPDNTWPYVPKIYRDNIPNKKQWPVFILKVLDGQQIAEIEDASGFIVYDKINPSKSEWHGMSGTKRIETLKKGISTWKNYKDKDGRLVEYKDESSIKLLSEKLKVELINAITERLTLSEDELRSLEL